MFPLESTLDTPVVSPSFETQSPLPCLTFEFQAYNAIEEKKTIHLQPFENNITLTPTELKAQQQAIRREKNRQSAKISRARKAEHIKELENQVAVLTAQNDNLMKIAQLLENENLTLKQEIAGYSLTEISRMSLRLR